MSNIDVEKQRMNSRITATWFAFMFGIVVAIYFIIQIFEYFSGMDSTMFLGSVIAVLIAFKYQPNIVRFYEKRFSYKKQPT